MGTRFIETELPGVVVCEFDVFGDERGFFAETYHGKRYTEGGIPSTFVQDNFSHSKQGILRGLHYQLKKPQAKLVSVINGVIFDVAVDIRTTSPTYKKWVGVELSSENRRQLYIPEGFAHGFCVLSDKADVMYKCSDFYDAIDDSGVIWSDPEIAIDWPVELPELSEKDAKLPSLSAAKDQGRLPA